MARISRGDGVTPTSLRLAVPTGRAEDNVGPRPRHRLHMCGFGRYLVGLAKEIGSQYKPRVWNPKTGLAICSIHKRLLGGKAAE